MQNFLSSIRLLSFLAWSILTFLILCHEPPTGPADEPYIEYEHFTKTWGMILLWIWVGLITLTLTSHFVLRWRYKEV